MESALTDKQIISTLDEYKYDWKDEDVAGRSAKRGISEEVVRNISASKKEPKWMLELRLNGYELFCKAKDPDFGPFVDKTLEDFDYNNFKYYVPPLGEGISGSDSTSNWEDLPESIRSTYERLGIPDAEKKRLVAGVAAQYESEVVYKSIREDLAKLGVIFVDTETGMRDYEDLFREHFGSVVPGDDNKLASLNLAVWSGGSFVYIPKGVRVEIPLQAYFRMNTQNLGQFERTLIIADEGSDVHYIEGCTAPIYLENSLHSGVVEIVVKKNAKVRYSTIQNWSTNVFNLVTQRALVHEGAQMEWVDANIGSKVTCKYPTSVLVGAGARAETLSIALAGNSQMQDTGAKMIHLAKNTHSSIVSKSVSKNGGRTSYRGLIKISKGAAGSSSNVVCDALLVDNDSRTDTYPRNVVEEEDVLQGHEATVSKINDDQLFYLMSRGISEQEAMAMIVRGFIEPIAKELPMEYALELNRLIMLQMEGSVG
ncbi:MAG: Fe-S cluster assembly protein SufB [Candidatus Ancillula sp.]|jgi:Fe-S cluster assembly protein SufB|nr:Fe-S cluster assembly protein SufB [Candidatus Ancillula sp.]